MDDIEVLLRLESMTFRTRIPMATAPRQRWIYTDFLSGHFRCTRCEMVVETATIAVTFTNRS